jgi:hypothetical protein
MNCKVVALDKSYNFRITFFNLQLDSYERNMYFFEDMLSTEKNLCVNYLRIKLFKIEKV